MNSQFAIKCKDWNKEERRVKDQELCEIVGLLEDRAMKRYGDPNVRRLRNEFQNGRVTFAKDTAGRMAMESLLVLEDDYLSAYIKQVSKIARSFWKTNRRCKVEVDDFIQEGCLALSNSVYHYNGSAAFTTYMHNAVTRALSVFVREYEELAGVARRIKALKKKVVRCMNQFGFELDEAVDYLVNEGDTISEQDKNQIADAIYRMTPLNPKIQLGEKQDDCPIDQELVHLCIEEAELTDVERRLIEAHMDGDNSVRSTMVETVVNETTGRLYTKQALSLAFNRACDKIREQFQARSVVTN